MIKNHKIRNTIVFLLMGGLSCYLIINKLINYQQWGPFFDSFAANPFQFALFALSQSLLWGINLLCETTKWHLLVQSTHRQGMRLSFRQTMGGFAWANLTPARLGEPVGKMIGLPPTSKMHALALSIFGSIMQNIIIVLVAIPASFIALTKSNTFGSITKVQVSHSTFLIVALMAAGLIAVIAGFKPFAKWFIRRFKMHRVLVGLTSKQMVLATVATLCRYACFSLQLALALIFFEPQLSPLAALALIPIYYLIITALPSFILTDLGIKGSVALYVFGAVTTNTPAIVAAAFFIWAINTALPTLIGVLMTIELHKKLAKPRFF